MRWYRVLGDGSAQQVWLCKVVYKNTRSRAWVILVSQSQYLCVGGVIKESIETEKGTSWKENLELLQLREFIDNKVYNNT